MGVATGVVVVCLGIVAGEAAYDYYYYNQIKNKQMKAEISFKGFEDDGNLIRDNKDGEIDIELDSFGSLKNIFVLYKKTRNKLPTMNHGSKIEIKVNELPERKFTFKAKNCKEEMISSVSIASIIITDIQEAIHSKDFNPKNKIKIEVTKDNVKVEEKNEEEK